MDNAVFVGIMTCQTNQQIFPLAWDGVQNWTWKLGAVESGKQDQKDVESIQR